MTPRSWWRQRATCSARGLRRSRRPSHRCHSPALTLPTSAPKWKAPPLTRWRLPGPRCPPLPCSRAAQIPVEERLPRFPHPEGEGGRRASAHRRHGARKGVDVEFKARGTVGADRKLPAFAVAELGAGSFRLCDELGEHLRSNSHQLGSFVSMEAAVSQVLRDVGVLLALHVRRLVIVAPPTCSVYSVAGAVQPPRCLGRSAARRSARTNSGVRGSVDRIH